MLTIEKVILLKSLPIFSQVPEEYLAEIAATLEELEVEAEEPILVKGELGSSLFIIVGGEVRVHDGPRELAVLGGRQVFGELAALDPEPRAADVTARTDCHLFQLDESSLYELIGEHVEVARGVIRVLCERLRS